jgi:hypothetical protein
VPLDLERRRGFLPVARKLFDGGDIFWPTPFKDRFSRGEAWLDLVQMAAFRDGAVVNGVRLKRGEVCGSLQWFARRWSWTVKAVRWFLKTCEETGRIAARSRARSRARTPSVYLLVNYGVYNSANDEKGTDWGTRTGTIGARLGHNDEEGKKGRSNTARAPRERKPDTAELRLTPPEGPTPPTPAQKLVNRVIEIGLKGRRPDGYAKQVKHANDLLERHTLEDLLAVVEALPGEFPYSQGRTFDVFDVGKLADKVLAKLQASSRTAPSAPAQDPYLTPHQVREIDGASR